MTEENLFRSILHSVSDFFCAGAKALAQGVKFCQLPKKEYAIKLELKVDGKEITSTQTLNDAANQTLQGFIEETCQFKGYQFLLKEIYLSDFKVALSDFIKNTILLKGNHEGQGDEKAQY